MANTLEGHFSRRTLAKGAAWSVPAVAVAVGAPAYAKSLTAPTATIATAVRASCTAANVTFTGVKDETYVVQASSNCSEWSGTLQVTGTGVSQAVTVAVPSTAQPVNCVRIASGTYTNQVLTQISEWVKYDLAALTGATGFTLSVSGPNRRFSWTTPTVLTNLVPSFTISATSPDREYGPTTDKEVIGVKNHNSATLTTTVCGLTFTTTWSASPGGNSSPTDSTSDETTESVKREASSTETQPAETKAPAKKSTEPKAAPAAQKSVPTAEPTSSPTPEPTVSVPEPTPVVTPPAVVPAPTASATPSA